MMTSVASFGEKNFGGANLRHERLTKCLVRIADLILPTSRRHFASLLLPGPPKDYKAMDRLMNQEEVTHATVLETSPPADLGAYARGKKGDSRPPRHDGIGLHGPAVDPRLGGRGRQPWLPPWLPVP